MARCRHPRTTSNRASRCSRAGGALTTGGHAPGPARRSCPTRLRSGGGPRLGPRRCQPFPGVTRIGIRACPLPRWRPVLRSVPVRRRRSPVRSRVHRPSIANAGLRRPGARRAFAGRRPVRRRAPGSDRHATVRAGRPPGPDPPAVRVAGHRPGARARAPRAGRTLPGWQGTVAAPRHRPHRDGSAWPAVDRRAGSRPGSRPARGPGSARGPRSLPSAEGCPAPGERVVTRRDVARERTGA